MDHEQEWDREQTLSDSEALLKSAARDDEEIEYSLESILAEFGDRELAELLGNVPPEDEDPPVGLRLDGARTETGAGPEAGRETRKASAEPEAPPAPEAPQKEPVKEPQPETQPEPPREEPQAAPPPPPEPTEMKLKDVLSQTVQSALDERQGAAAETPPKRRTLFSRRELEDTEQLYDEPEDDESDEEDDSFFDEPEAPVEETLSRYRRAAKATLLALRVSAIVTALMWLPQVLMHFGAMPQSFLNDRTMRTLPFLLGLALVCVLGRSVFARAAKELLQGRITCELTVCLLCLTALADSVLTLKMGARGFAAQPFHSLAALAMTFALWGRYFYLRSMYDTFRIAAIGDAPYMITITEGGAAKRDGSVRGFTNCAAREDAATRWQTVLLPVILTATLVFAVLSTLKAQTWALFLWNWSVLLSGAAALGFPLCYALPLRRITDRLTKGGSAVAGYAGADAIRRSNCVILTDTDLFPPGTLTLNGLKIFGEESSKVFSYAATMARASGSGLERLFDNLLLSEGGFHETVSDLEFFEEGGVGGTIHGETVLLGTENFCRKKGVILPHGLKLKTGVFLAVDGTLIAIFAVKYNPAENVDWALHALHRNRITPVLAVRDGNITPALLKRKFDTDARAVYPKLSTRLALSEHDGYRPYALLMREGLTPYAEVAVGSKRLCRAVRVGSLLSILGSVSGTLLAFYLTFISAQRALSPLTMLAYLLLWAVASLIEGFFADRY